jgi:hypothetical protein
MTTTHFHQFHSNPNFLGNKKSLFLLYLKLCTNHCFLLFLTLFPPILQKIYGCLHCPNNSLGLHQISMVTTGDQKIWWKVMLTRKSIFLITLHHQCQQVAVTVNKKIQRILLYR